MDRTLLNTLFVFSFALLLLYLLFLVLSPLLGTLVWAVAIGMITFPLYEKLLGRCKGRETIASALMTMAVVLAVIIPLVGLVFALSREAALAYQYLEQTDPAKSGLALTNILRHPAVAPWLKKISPLIGSLNVELDTMLLPAIKKSMSYVLKYSTGIIKDSFGLLVKLVMMLIILFFVYRDGLSFMRRFWLVVPVRHNIRTTIAETVARVLRGVLYGILLTCLVQGTLGGLGFWVAGLPSPFLFGAMMAICAIIPVVGTALIWLPAAIYLLIQGKTLYGLALIAWGLLVVGSIDNVIRPLFISGKARLPFLIIALGALGGVLAFGASGIVAGPVILALFLVFFEMSREEYIIEDRTSG